VGLAFRSVGYMGVALPDVPFYEKWGTIPHILGRVLTVHNSDTPHIGNYVVGWIKRGPSGIIGTNKPDSIETAESLLADFRAGQVLSPKNPSREAVESLLKGRGVRVVTYADWQRLDRLEVARGEAVGRPRLKFCSVVEMLTALDENPS